jgi:hypothetical protein
MFRKILFTVALASCFSVLPSYTNTCARPDAAFMKVDVAITVQPDAAAANVRAKAAELEVFPLSLISIDL